MGKNNVVTDALSCIYSDKPVRQEILQYLAQFIWDEVPLQAFHLYLISDPRAPSSALVSEALMRIKAAYRLSTRAAHNIHCRTYLLFLFFMNLPVSFSLHSLQRHSLNSYT